MKEIIDMVGDAGKQPRDVKQHEAGHKRILDLTKQLQIRRIEQEENYQLWGTNGSSKIDRTNEGEQTSTSSGERNGTNEPRGGHKPPHIESSSPAQANGAFSDGSTGAHRVPDKDPTSGSGNDRTSMSSTDQPKPSKPEKGQHWLAKKTAGEALKELAFAKLGDELINHGLTKHLGFGGEATDITIKGVEAKNIRLYVTKDEEGKITDYYITTKGKASLEAKHKVKNLHEEKLDLAAKDHELIDLLARNFDKIQWDLPKIHAIRTVELKDTGLKNIRAPRVLITDSEDVVQQRMLYPQTESEKGDWKGALPGPSPIFEISSKNPTKEERLIEKEKRLIYKALHGEISNGTKNKKMYTDNKELLDIIDKNMMEKVNSKETCRDFIKQYEKNLILFYYDSNSYIQKELERKLSDYGACIEGIKKKFKERPQDNTIGREIVKFLNDTFEAVRDIWNQRKFAYRAINHQLSGIGFDQLGDGSKTKVDIKGDLYLVSEDNGGIRLTNKRPDDDSALVDVKQLEQIEKEPDKIKWDLKLYIIQRPDQISTEGDSNDKKPEILVTDDRDLVARMRKQGWDTLPWTESGIELGQGDEQFHQNYKEFYEHCDQNTREQLDRCHKGMNKIYWERSGDYRREDLMKKFTELKESLKGYKMYTEGNENETLVKKVQENIKKLDRLVEDVLEQDYRVKNSVIPVLKEKLDAELKVCFSNYKIETHVGHIPTTPLKVFEHEGSLYLSYADEVKFRDESGKEVSFTRKYFVDCSDEDLAREKVQWKFVTTSLLLGPKEEGDQDGPKKQVLWVTNVDQDAIEMQKQAGWNLLGSAKNVDVKWGDIEGGLERMMSSFKGLLKEQYKNPNAVDSTKGKNFQIYSKKTL